MIVFLCHVSISFQSPLRCHHFEPPVVALCIAPLVSSHQNQTLPTCGDGHNCIVLQVRPLSRIHAQHREVSLFTSLVLRMIGYEAIAMYLFISPLQALPSILACKTRSGPGTDIIVHVQGLRNSRFVLLWTGVQFSNNLPVSFFEKVVAFDLQVSISIRHCSNYTIN